VHCALCTGSEAKFNRVYKSLIRVFFSTRLREVKNVLGCGYTATTLVHLALFHFSTLIVLDEEDKP